MIKLFSEHFNYAFMKYRQKDQEINKKNTRDQTKDFS